MEDKLLTKIDEILRAEMVTIGIDVDDAKTGQMWAFDSERLAKKIIPIIRADCQREWGIDKMEKLIWIPVVLIVGLVTLCLSSLFVMFLVGVWRAILG